MISVELRGRLSNQLFQYAVCKSVAIKNNYDYYIPRNFLPNKLLRLDCDLGIEQSKFYYSFIQKSEDLHRDIFSIRDFTLISGFFQSEYYFKDIERDIKKVTAEIQELIKEDLDET